MNITRFKQTPLLGILRGVKESMIEPLLEAAISGGLGAIEITMNTKGAAGLIKKMTTLAKGRIPVGAGTVLSMDSMKEALQAGASFIVSPTLVKDVTEYCDKNYIPVFPGAFTPQEIFNAWQAGATMVKVFPAKFFGPDYIKEIKGPLNQIELLACGGVSTDNIGEFFNKGASAAAFGGSVFKQEWLEAGDFEKIEACIKTLVKNIPLSARG